jgi:LmbE family N-acetylglucosaminyl deacetylase
MLRALFLALILAASSLNAQPTPLKGAAELHELLDQLNTVGSLLMLGAHPDDENTTVISYFARGRHIRTAYFSATRGEGGQNLIGTEQGPLMGMIRTQELLEARRIDGGEQFFSSAIDFGFSKAPEEALAKWGHERLLRDMVRTIREFRPDVILSRFPPKPGGGGHGQHTAVGWTGPEAYEAAADPNKFPELGLPVWKAHRFYYNTPTFNRRMEDDEAQRADRLRLELGEYDPVLGKSYAEIAGKSRSQHRSQGMGAGQRKGSVPAFFSYVAGERTENDLFDGIDTSWNRVEGGKRIGELLAKALADYEFAQPDAILPHLLQAYRALASLEKPELAYKQKQLARAIEVASGIWVDASADRWNLVPGKPTTVTLSALRRTSPAWTWKTASIAGAGEAAITAAADLPSNQVVEHTVDVTPAGNAAYSQPPWMRAKTSGDYYENSDGSPEAPEALTATFVFETPEGVDVTIKKPVRYRWVDRSYGERERRLQIVPAVAVGFTRENQIFTTSDVATVPVRLYSNDAIPSARVELTAPQGWSVSPKSIAVEFARAGQEKTVEFELTPPANASGGVLQASATVGDKTITVGMQTIEYDHIATQMVYPPAEMRVERIDVKMLSKSIGYVMGAGDKVPAALEQLGAKVTLLSDVDLASGDLSQYDAIVCGVRALNTRADLMAARERVLAFVEAGGTLIVQYNTLPFGRGRARPAGPSLAPYPLTPSRERVTDELAEVTFVAPDHLLLQAPNKITAKDFEGWVQERGLYYMSEWDEHYEPILASSDPGEETQRGGMLYARYGKGVYIFTGHSWFRQLPAGVPGAYRLFANLVSVGKLR